MPARPRHQRHYELASWELASWAAAKGVLVWQADVALATLELYTAAITPDSSALSHTVAGVTRRFAGSNEPVPDELAKHYRASQLP